MNKVPAPKERLRRLKELKLAIQYSQSIEEFMGQFLEIMMYRYTLVLFYCLLFFYNKGIPTRNLIFNRKPKLPPDAVRLFRNQEVFDRYQIQSLRVQDQFRCIHLSFLSYQNILMQIQKHLFRISQKLLKSENAPFWCRVIFTTLSILALIFGILVVVGHLFVLNNNTELSRCILEGKPTILEDQFYYVTTQQFSKAEITYYQQSKKIVSDNEECTIVYNKNESDSDEGTLVFGWDQASMFMEKQKKNKLVYNNLTFSLKNTNSLRNLVYHFDILIINQILENPLEAIPFSEKFLMIKSKSAYVFHQSNPITGMMKVGLLLKVMLCYILISVVTSLYIYGTIIAAPALIILMIKCCRFLRQDSMSQIFKLFPWIGIHAIIRQTSTTPIIKESTSHISRAILYYFLFLYLVYYATIMWIDKIAFRSHVQLGLQQILFGYIALSQFCSIIFMRTRTFIKYFPSFNTLIIISMLYYVQICDFGLKKLVFYTGFCLSFAFFSYLILNLEIPAHTTWDQNSLHTPKEDRPRIGYFPLFNMSWMKNLPQEWSLMVPLFGRQNFDDRQMALVDRNNQLLQEILANP